MLKRAEVEVDYPQQVAEFIRSGNYAEAANTLTITQRNLVTRIHVYGPDTNWNGGKGRAYRALHEAGVTVKGENGWQLTADGVKIALQIPHTKGRRT